MTKQATDVISTSLRFSISRRETSFPKKSYNKREKKHKKNRPRGTVLSVCFSCFGENVLRMNEGNHSRPSTPDVPGRRQFSEKEQTPLSPTTVSIFGPHDSESTTAGISLDATTIARRGSSGASQNSLYTLYIGFDVDGFRWFQDEGRTTTKKPPKTDGLVCLLLRRRGESGLS